MYNVSSNYAGEALLRGQFRDVVPVELHSACSTNATVAAFCINPQKVIDGLHVPTIHKSKRRRGASQAVGVQSNGILASR
jgi:hypothetical protein